MLLCMEVIWWTSVQGTNTNYFLLWIRINKVSQHYGLLLLLNTISYPFVWFFSSSHCHFGSNTPTTSHKTNTLIKLCLPPSSQSWQPWCACVWRLCILEVTEQVAINYYKYISWLKITVYYNRKRKVMEVAQLEYNSYFKTIKWT